MNLLLDTHVLLWWLNDSKMSHAAQQSISDPHNGVYVSAASVWEISIKQAIGKLELEADILEAIEGIQGLKAEAEKVEELAARWWAEAERNQVLPVDNRPFSDYIRGRPDYLPARTRYEYWRDQPPVPESAVANVKDRDHLVTAEVDVPGIVIRDQAGSIARIVEASDPLAATGPVDGDDPVPRSTSVARGAPDLEGRALRGLRDESGVD